MSSMLPPNSAADISSLANAAGGFPLSISSQGLDSPEIRRIVEMTERMFGAPVELSIESDPDSSPEDTWIEFACLVPEEYAAYRQRRSQWYDEVARLVPGATTEFRLCLTSTHDG